MSAISRRLFLGFALLLAGAASAQLSIEITGAGANRIPVAIADFAGDAGLARALTSVIRGDLERSGLFRLVDTSGAALNESSAIDFVDWKDRGADAIAAGSLGTAPDGRLEALGTRNPMIGPLPVVHFTEGRAQLSPFCRLYIDPKLDLIRQHFSELALPGGTAPQAIEGGDGA